MSEIFSNFSKKYFLKIFWNCWKSRFSKFEISKSEILDSRNLKLDSRNLKKKQICGVNFSDFENRVFRFQNPRIEISRFQNSRIEISKNFYKIFRKYFLEKLEKFRTSRSKQNFTADRMEALSASENHSKAYLLSKHLFFPWFSANRLYRFWWYFQVFGYYWNRFFPSILVRKPRLSMNKCRDQHGDGWFLEEHPSSGCVQSFKRIGDREPSPTNFPQSGHAYLGRPS